LLPKFRKLIEKSSILTWGVVSSDDFRAKQGENTAVRRGVESAVVEDSLDSVERRVVETVNYCCIGDIGVSCFFSIVECLMCLLDLSFDSDSGIRALLKMR
jgi:hypothetical protein